MKKSKKALCSALAALTLIAGVSAPSAISSFTNTEPVSIVQSIDANAASVTRGRFNGTYWTGYTTVYSSNTRNSKKIKLCTFDMMGWRSGGTVDVEAYSGNRCIYSNYNGITTAANIYLPKGYSSYKVRIRPHNYGSGWFASARNFENNGRCVMWSIDH